MEGSRRAAESWRKPPNHPEDVQPVFCNFPCASARDSISAFRVSVSGLTAREVKSERLSIIGGRYWLRFP